MEGWRAGNYQDCICLLGCVSVFQRSLRGLMVDAAGVWVEKALETRA